MRENKFRAWVKELSVLANVVVINFEIGKVVLPIEAESTYWWHTSTFDLKDVVLMQCTGLKDDEGNDIYGGDIVEFCDFESLRTGGAKDDTIHMSVVKMSEGSWIVENDKHRDYLYQVLVNDSDVRVIGNIYENPDLLVNEGGA